MRLSVTDSDGFTARLARRVMSVALSLARVAQSADARDLKSLRTVFSPFPPKLKNMNK